VVKSSHSPTFGKIHAKTPQGCRRQGPATWRCGHSPWRDPHLAIQALIAANAAQAGIVDDKAARAAVTGTSVNTLRKSVARP